MENFVIFDVPAHLAAEAAAHPMAALYGAVLIAVAGFFTFHRSV